MSTALNGSKQWITFANAADTGILLPRPTGGGPSGGDAFIVQPKNFAGFTANPIPMTGLSKPVFERGLSR